LKVEGDGANKKMGVVTIRSRWVLSLVVLLALALQVLG
jgi:hypothetical protein